MVLVGYSASPRSGPWSTDRWLARSTAIHAPLERPAGFALGFPHRVKAMTSVLFTLGSVLSRSRDVGLSVPQVIHAAQVPAGVPDPYPADPTHPSAWYTCRAGSQPAISPIPCPWHRARPTCAWRHVRSTFNLSRCLCASLCM